MKINRIYEVDSEDKQRKIRVATERSERSNHRGHHQLARITRPVKNEVYGNLSCSPRRDFQASLDSFRARGESAAKHGSGLALSGGSSAMSTTNLKNIQLVA